MNHTFKKALIVALTIQVSLAAGFFLCLIVSYFYLFLGDSRFPKERPEVLWAGFLMSLLCFVLGTYFSKVVKDTRLSLKQSSLAVIFAWLIATAISATVFVLAGFPIPDEPARFSLVRRFVDGIFESISGFTTAGGSILPSVEVFPRSILMWRSTTHFLGGMGMTFMAITFLRNFVFNREPLINSESEGPNHTSFSNEKDAITAGVDFFKTYTVLTVILAILLFFSGVYSRSTPYLHWYDDAFDSINHAFSVMGTGGFGTYDTSAGLPIQENGITIIGGLRSPVSEWIIAIFMMIAGSNIMLWYFVIFKRSLKEIFESMELRAYVIFVSAVTLAIWSVLILNNVYGSPFDALRYAFFNVTTIISTTGLANSDFTKWPAAAEGLLFSCYLVGGMVGSTAGGLKILRFLILGKYTTMKLQNLIYGRFITRFTIDGMHISDSIAGLVVTNALLYYMIFLGGAIGIMVLSPQNILPDGTITTVDFTSAITASIANLGNIGPALEIGNINAGPTGNYFAYSVPAKLLMSLLMLIGRIGVITFVMMFITQKGILRLNEAIPDEHFDSDHPLLHKA